MKRFLCFLLLVAGCGSDSVGPDGAVPDGMTRDGESACGLDQQPCCAGEVCEGLRLCNGGVCAASDVWAAGHNEMPYSAVVIHGTMRFISTDAYTFFAVWGSGSDVWAGGGVFDPTLGGAMLHVIQPLALFRTQTQPIFALSGSSSSDVWAGGTDETGMLPAVVHWDGARWSNAMMFIDDVGALTGIYASAANDAWVACSDNKLYRWNGTAWSAPYSVPGLTATQGIFAIGGTHANDIWVAGGESTASTGFVSHWDGSQWSAPSTIGLSPFDISGSGPGDMWIVGKSSADGAAVHFDGSAWSSPSTFAGTPLTRVSAGSSSNVWAIAYQQSTPLVMHWNGTRWSAPQQIRGATSLYAVWVPPGP